MKKTAIIFYFGLFAFQINQLAAQTIGWTQLSFVPNNDLNAVHCINKDTVIAVGDNGYIIRTTDGGTHWDSIPSNTVNTLSKVTFLNDTIGYACGTKGTVLKTSNGGQNWVNVGISTSMDFLSMSFINKDTGWVAGGIGDFFHYGPLGSKGVLAKTVDGGNTWSIDSSFTKTIASVFFIDKDTGFICLNNFPISLLEKTIDAGNTFTINNYDSLTTNYIYNIHFINSKIGYFSSNATPDYHKDGIFKTEDYGQTWIKILDQWGITSSFVLDSCILYVFYTEMPGTGAYGKNNCLENVIQSPWFIGMHLIDEDYGFCVGSEIYKRGIVQSINESKIQKLEVFPNPFHDKTTISFTSSSSTSMILVYDIHGELCFAKSCLVNNGTAEIDLSSQPQGLYYLIIKEENKIIYSTKLIKI